MVRQLLLEVLKQLREVGWQECLSLSSVLVLGLVWGDEHEAQASF